MVARTNASKFLDTYEKALVYSKMDGIITQVKLEQLSGVPRRTISDWMIVFVESGLAAPPDDYYRNYRALFTPRELSIEIAALKKRHKVISPATQAQEPRGEGSE
jgi:hypothetical protein